MAVWEIMKVKKCTGNEAWGTYDGLLETIPMTYDTGCLQEQKENRHNILSYSSW